MDSMWCWNVVAFIVLFIAKTANPAHQMAGKYGDAIDFTKICKIYFEDRVEKKRTWSNQAPYHPLKETVLLGDLTTEGGSKLQEIFEEYKKTMKGDEAVTICKLDALAHQISLPTLVEDWKEIVVPLSKMITNSIPAVMSPNAHFIGEGVGAHLWHGVSEELKRIVNNPMKRITGLDPTGVCFDPAQADKCKGKAFPQYMINKKDAEYVDVILTGREYWGICKPPIEGEKSELAHALFFANGGYRQPGCQRADSGALHKACSHWRAGELWLESMRREDVFNASGCRDNSVSICDRRFGKFGRKSDKNTRGVFGFATEAKSPYGIPLGCWPEATSDGKDEFVNCHVEDH